MRWPLGTESDVSHLRRMLGLLPERVPSRCPGVRLGAQSPARVGARMSRRGCDVSV